MPRLSTLSNPTGLVDLDKKRISILVDESSKKLSFSLVGLDVSDLKLPGNARVVVIVRRANNEERLELGTLLSWKRGYQTIADLGEDGSLVFRVLIVSSESSKLVAAAENIRPAGNGDSESFIGLEAAELGEIPWEVEVHDQEGRATIRFNREIYQSVGAVESDRMFIGLVLPEAVRAIARVVAVDPAMLEDEPWHPFRSWLAAHEITEEPEVERESEWVNTVVSAFCSRFEFSSQLKELRLKGAEE